MTNEEPEVSSPTDPGPGSGARTGGGRPASAPTGPVTPTGPAGPATPTGPVTPAGPAGRATPTGPVTERGDVPPRQRATPPRPQTQQSRRPEPPAPAPAPAKPPPTAEERAARPVAGSPAQSTEVAPAAPARDEAYRSELPDLSRAAQLPVPQKPAPDRDSTQAVEPVGSASRIQVGQRQRGPVRASMQIRRVDPWSVLKVSLVLSVALFFVWMIAVAFLYLTLGGMGVWSKLNSNVGDLLTNTANTELVSSGAIFGGATLIGLVNIVLLTAMATVGAFIYNLTTDLVGGVEVTLADRD